MLKAALFFLAGIFCGFSFSWIAPTSIAKYWRASEHDANKTSALENRDKEMYRDDGNKYVTKQMVDEVTVLCMVMTSPETHNRTEHIKATWGRRCNVLLFFSSVDDETVPTVALPVAAGENYDWQKTKQAFKYVHDKNYLDEVGWVLKTDDETYVVVENLRYLLAHYDSYEAVYFGRYVKNGMYLPESEKGYMEGQAGYVLSEEAVRRLAVEYKTCGEYLMVDVDSGMGKCMELLKVKAGVSKDRLGKERFHLGKPSEHILNQLVIDPRLNLKNNHFFYDGRLSLDCCSDSAITFHGISYSYMYTMEYFLYHLNPYGILRSIDVQPNIARSQANFTSQPNTTFDPNLLVTPTE